MRWRVGRKVGRTIYKDDRLVGMMDDRADAADAVHALNRQTLNVFGQGAAVAFGLMGMAIEIRETYLCRNCGSWQGNLVAYHGCQCENDE